MFIGEFVELCGSAGVVILGTPGSKDTLKSTFPTPIESAVLVLVLVLTTSKNTPQTTYTPEVFTLVMLRFDCVPVTLVENCCAVLVEEPLPTIPVASS